MVQGTIAMRRFLTALLVCFTLWLVGLLIARVAVTNVCQTRSHCWLEGSLTFQQSFRIKIKAPRSEDEEQIAVLQAKAHADADGVVVWTLANYSWLDFVLNWATTAQRAGVRHYFVACLDAKLAAELQQRGIAAVRMPVDLGEEELLWGSDSFKQRGKEKIKFIMAMLRGGLKPLFADLDVIWLQDPVPFLAALPEADLLLSLDLLQPTSTILKLEQCPDILGDTLMGMMNVGIHFMRPGAVPALEAWLLGMEESKEMEQRAFNDILTPGLERATEDSYYCRALAGQVTLGLLSPVAFANGHIFYTQGLSEWEDVTPGLVHAVHTSFIVGRDTKRHYMREWGQWVTDEPARYSPAGGFLTFDLHVPKNMLQDALPPDPVPGPYLSAEDVQGHIQLMGYQFTQLRAAMQVAQLLGRELVVPRLWCALDYGWNAHNGRVGGTRPYKLPFNCPLGKVIDTERWAEMSREHRLPVFHESKLLEHPLMVNHSRLVVSANSFARLMGPLHAGSGVSNRSALHEAARCSSVPEPGEEACRLELGPAMNSSTMSLALQEYSKVNVIHFDQVTSVWGGLSGDAGLDFEHAVEGLAKQWCCSVDNERFDVYL